MFVAGNERYLRFSVAISSALADTAVTEVASAGVGSLLDEWSVGFL